MRKLSCLLVGNARIFRAQRPVDRTDAKQNPRPLPSVAGAGTRRRMRMRRRFRNSRPPHPFFQPDPGLTWIDCDGGETPIADLQISCGRRSSEPRAKPKHWSGNSPMRFLLVCCCRLRSRTYRNPDTTLTELRRRPSIRADQNQPRKSIQISTPRNLGRRTSLLKKHQVARKCQFT